MRALRLAPAFSRPPSNPVSEYPSTPRRLATRAPTSSQLTIARLIGYVMASETCGDVSDQGSWSVCLRYGWGKNQFT